MTQKTDEKGKVHDLLKSFSTAMFVTLGGEGRLEARPMHIAQVEDADEICFLTGQGGTLAGELHTEPVVLLTFQKDNSVYLSLHGRARADHDAARIKELWKEPYKVWFPLGPDDPDITLVCVEPIDAEYWDNRGANKLEYLFKAAKAYVKKETPQISDGDLHAKINL
jgi:general stress protein 26